MADRIKQTSERLPGGGVNVNITCTVCDEPIDHANEYGMYCKNECGIDEDRSVFALLTGAFGPTVIADVISTIFGRPR
jgi:hypothetical protein